MTLALKMKNRKTIIGVIIAVALAIMGVAVNRLNWALARAESSSCNNHMRRLSGAKDQTAQDLGLSSTTVVTRAMMEYLFDSESPFPVCPSGGEYILGPVDSDPQCTFYHTNARGHDWHTL